MNIDDFDVVFTAYWGKDRSGTAVVFGPESEHSVEAIAIALTQYVWAMISIEAIDAGDARQVIEQAAEWITGRAIQAIDQMFAGECEHMPKDVWETK